MPSSIYLSILGGFSLRVDGQEASALPRKARALLAYLAVQRDRPVSREAVGELLWSDRGEDQVRHSLRQTLAVSRKIFRGRDLVLSRDGALSLADDIAIDADPCCKVDVDEVPAEEQDRGEHEIGDEHCDA